MVDPNNLVLRSGWSLYVKKKKSKSKSKSTPKDKFTSKVKKLLDRFLSSQDPVFTFEDKLNSLEWENVHNRCQALGLVAKSSGPQADRRVSVYKVGDERIPPTLDLSPEAEGILMDLFRQYPPREVESVKQNICKDVYKSLDKIDDFFCRPEMDSKQIEDKMKSLADRVEKDPKLKQIFEKKSKLPIVSFRNDVMSTIAEHQVVLISGESGCGKTTQVPQLLLDYMWAKSESCKIVCTQPRCFSAMSVAERVSEERGESIGESVGYKTRLESIGGRQSSILFCTNEIMLRVLVSEGVNGSQSTGNNISELTHIIVDEIHERDRYSDFIIAILRDLLPVYRHLRLVLMSATLDAERFSEYFGGCPIIRVPGFTHPVKSFYLDDVFPMLNSASKNHINATSSICSTEEVNIKEDYCATLDDAMEMACSNEDFDPLLRLIHADDSPKVLNYQHSSTGVSTLMLLAGKGRVSDVCTLLYLGADCHLQASDRSTALDWAVREDQHETAEIIKKHMESTIDESMEENLLKKYMSTIDPEFIDVILIEKLLKKICSESMDGAILVFLPGWDYINRIQERLQSNQYFQNSSKFMIVPLHPMVPSVEQKKVFAQPPPGCRKIVLSTNISETAVTIDDVVYVIDSGRVKEKSYDPYNKVSTLQTCWISQASAKQREGRAGHCQPGVCYHLYSKMMSLQPFQVPEIRRMSVEELCLQVKILNPNCKIEEFLKKTLDPPLTEAIKTAIGVLQEIGALSLDEQLTELGEKLGCLPLHPSISKMLFFAIMLNCLDPALTLACAANIKDPFVLPISKRERTKVDAAKAQFASLYGGYSYHLATIAAFVCWRKAKEIGVERRFCSKYFVSQTSMHMLARRRTQLQTELISGGFMADDDVSTFSMNARDPGILRAIIVAALYPMVCNLPTSGNRPLLVFDELISGDGGGLLTRNFTAIAPLPLLLLATDVVVAPWNNYSDGGSDRDEMEIDKVSEQRGKIMSSPDNLVTVIVDRWLLYQSTALQIAQICCLRERLSSAILFKVANPNRVLPPELGASIYAIACLFSFDGLSGISSANGLLPYVTPSRFLTSLVEPLPTRDEESYECARLLMLQLEAKRLEFEAMQKEADTRCKQAEARRKVAEARRKVAEARRKEAEAMRKVAEARCKQAETRRKEAEARIVEAEAKRKEAQARCAEADFRPAEAVDKPKPVVPPGTSSKVILSMTQEPGTPPLAPVESNSSSKKRKKQVNSMSESRPIQTGSIVASGAAGPPGTSSKLTSSMIQEPGKQPLASMESKSSRKKRKRQVNNGSESQPIQTSSIVAAGAVGPPGTSSKVSSSMTQEPDKQPLTPVESKSSHKKRKRHVNDGSESQPIQTSSIVAAEAVGPPGTSSKVSSSMTQEPDKQPLTPVESKSSHKKRKKLIIIMSESQPIQANSIVEAKRVEFEDMQKEAEARPAEAVGKPEPVVPPGTSSKVSSSMTQEPGTQPLAPVKSKLSRKKRKKLVIIGSENQPILTSGAGSMLVEPLVPFSQAS